MRLVVTGASGFLGGAVVSESVRRGWDTLGVSRRPWAPPPGATALRCTGYHAIPAGDALVHMAEDNDISSVELSGDAYYHAALGLVERLVEQTRGRLIYGSSATVYGGAETQPHKVDDPVIANSTYTRTKLTCEQRVLAAGGTVLRFSNLFGPGMSHHNVLGDILRQIPGTGALRVRDAAPIRDFLWISDAAKAVCDAVAANLHGVFNVGSGVGASIGELATRCLRLAGEGTREVQATARGDPYSCLVVAVDSTTRACGWQPTTPLDVGLARLLTERLSAVDALAPPDSREISAR
jgi:nucleoside-diphosphate-sugar epimerase